MMTAKLQEEAEDQAIDQEINRNKKQQISLQIIRQDQEDHKKATHKAKITQQAPQEKRRKNTIDRQKDKPER